MTELPCPDLKNLTHAQKDELILFLWEQNQQLMRRVAQLEQEVAQLKEQLSKNSRNSSKPPSSDGYGKPQPKSQRKKSGRSSGGQCGHKGQTLKQVEHPDQSEDHEVTHCAHCAADLSTHDSSEYEARQVFDLPEIQLKVMNTLRGLSLPIVNKGGRPKSNNPKQVVTIYLSPEVTEYFRARGKVLANSH
ncbi:MAG: DUF6444 domain-containing protein [Gammaproteobacteria bacterium]|nr:DUF6444 domain-containing protein [Gammaproteobacteria bacterium]